MDAYAWSTTTRQAQECLQDRITAAAHRRAQLALGDQTLHRHHLRLALSTLLITAGTRLQTHEQVTTQQE